jgi:nucleoporin GLE1
LQAQQIATALTNLQSAGSQTYVWGLNHLSKALIKQAETEVTARLEVAFPLARLVHALISQHNHAQLGDVLMARLVKKCFWITGAYPPRSRFPDDAAHQKALGHNVQSSESLMAYAQRMTGIMSLYTAICALSNPSSPAHFHPSALWTLLVSLFSLPLSSLEPVPQIIETILFIAGKTLLQAYGKQWAKLWQCLLEQGIRAKKAEFNQKDAAWVRASIVKLTLLLEDWKTKGIQEVPGSQPEP